jgi:hypothetical protein
MGYFNIWRCLCLSGHGALYRLLPRLCGFCSCFSRRARLGNGFVVCPGDAICALFPTTSFMANSALSFSPDKK